MRRGQVQVQEKTYAFEDSSPAMGFRRFRIVTPLEKRDDRLIIEIIRAVLAVNAPALSLSADGSRVEGSGFDLEFEFTTNAGEVIRLPR